MIGYVKRKKVLAELKREMEFNWNMQKRYGDLATTLKDPAMARQHLEMQIEYIHRWSESSRIYNILKQMT